MNIWLFVYLKNRFIFEAFFTIDSIINDDIYSFLKLFDITPNFVEFINYLNITNVMDIISSDMFKYCDSTNYIIKIFNITRYQIKYILISIYLEI